MKSYLLGIDVGTYSSKAVLTDLAGQVVHTAVVQHGISMPHPGHVEQDADRVWWADVCQLSRQILVESGARPNQIAALAVSAIGPCLLPLDATMRPLRPAILYGVDVRAAAEIRVLVQELGAQAISDFSLMALTSQAVGPKIRWLQKNEPQVWDAAGAHDALGHAQRGGPADGGVGVGARELRSDGETCWHAAEVKGGD